MLKQESHSSTNVSLQTSSPMISYLTFDKEIATLGTIKIILKLQPWNLVANMLKMFISRQDGSCCLKICLNCNLYELSVQVVTLKYGFDVEYANFVRLQTQHHRCWFRLWKQNIHNFPSSHFNVHALNNVFYEKR